METVELRLSGTTVVRYDHKFPGLLVEVEPEDLTALARQLCTTAGAALPDREIGHVTCLARTPANGRRQPEPARQLVLVGFLMLLSYGLWGLGLYKLGEIVIALLYRG